MALKTEPFVINIGPQHPSTHGVFRMIVTLDGETVVDLVPVFGYLHRGTEKLGESHTYVQIIPYTDRLDYIAAMSNNLGYVLAIEKLTGTPVPERADYLRVIFAELARLSNHLLAIGFFLNDLGAFFTPLLYMWREREKVLDMFEMTCGQRLTNSYMRIGGVSFDPPEHFWPTLKTFLAGLPRYLDEFEQLLMENEILLIRTKGVGIVPAEIAIAASISGPVLRASGVPFDLRKAEPYCVYDRLNFNVPVGTNGDCYDRYRIRIWEMRESLKIIWQCVEQLPGGPSRTWVPWTFRPPKGEAYAAVEGPKGELGYYVVSDGGISPYRMKIRSPSFINLQVLRDMCIGMKLADVVVNLGSIDIVMGEVDR